MQKNQGGGNSLKFRVKSEEVRVGRAASLFAAIFNPHSLLSFFIVVVITAIAPLVGLAVTTQQFLFVGQSSGESDWATVSSWMYSNGGKGGNWKTPENVPDYYGYDVFFRSPMNARNGNQCSHKEDWNHVVTFSRLQKNVGHVWVDEGSTEKDPIVFAATDDDNGLDLTPSGNLVVGHEFADGYLKMTRGTYKVNWLQVGAKTLPYRGSLTIAAEGGDTVSLVVNATGDTLLVHKGSVTVANSATIESKGNVRIKDATVHVKQGGKMKLNAWCAVGYLGNATGKLEIDGGEVESTANRMTIGDVDNSTGIVVIKNGGKYSNIEPNDVGGITVGQNASGTLEVDNGEVNLGGNTFNVCGSASSTAAVTIKGGGVVKTKGVVYGSGTGGATITLNGGMLAATMDTDSFIPGNQNLTVVVGESGGTIDNGGHAITIGSALGGVGSMTFTGSGTTTLGGDVNYSGTTFVMPGTKLNLANEDAKTKILAGGLVLVGLPVADRQVVTSTSAFEDTDLTKVLCPLAPTTTFKFTDETKTGIAVDVPGDELDNYWTGAANDGELSNVDNWSGGSVPQSGNAYIFCTTNSTLTKGGTFAPSHITFVGGSAAATINGDFSGIAQIANNSAGIVEFMGAVEFSGNVDVMQLPGVVKFTGGAAGVKLTRAMDIHGSYTFSQPGDFTEIGGTTVKNDGIYKLPNGTFYKHNADFHVEAGGKTVVKNAKINNNSSKTLLGTFNGLFVVTNQFVVSGNATHYMLKSGSGTFVINELRVNQNGKIVPADKTIMGPGGIIRGTAWVRVKNSGSHEFGSYADWTMYYEKKGANTSTGLPVFYKHSSSSSWSYLTFDTTDYYDSAIGHTITCEAPIAAADAASAEKFRVTVKGKGTFVFANTHDDKNKTEKIFSGGLVVQDTATVEVKADAKPGTGAITLNAGTTLALVYSSGGNGSPLLANKLNLPTEGAATIRIDGKRLGSGDYEITTIGSGNIENVALDLDSAALDGRKASLRVEDGKLFLNIKPDGFKVIVR